MKQKLREALLKKLPGQSAHGIMTSAQRRFQLENIPSPFEPRKSGVLILLYEQDQSLQTLMIQRPQYDGVHSGQIAFPGGKMEDSDTDLTATALRETTEEIGIPAEQIEVLGKLTELYIPPSNFLVQPVVGWINHVPDTFPDPNEVEAILRLPLNDFINKSSLQQREVDIRNFKISVPCYVIQGYVIWGASAMIMAELLEVFSNLSGN
ncbi:MAG: CoA pyrophosphatase [Bacteroidota bacterium]